MTAFYFSIKVLELAIDRKGRKTSMVHACILGKSALCLNGAEFLRNALGLRDFQWNRGSGAVLRRGRSVNRVLGPFRRWTWVRYQFCSLISLAMDDDEKSQKKKEFYCVLAS